MPRSKFANFSTTAARDQYPKWWDGQNKDKGGGDVRNTRNRSVTGSELSAYNLDRMIVSRLRKAYPDLQTTQRKIDTEIDRAWRKFSGLPKAQADTRGGIRLATMEPLVK